MTMTDSPAPDTFTFALSQEELYVVLAYLKAPAFIELEDFEKQVFNQVPSSQKTAMLQVAERGLLAREYLGFTTDHQLALNPALAQVIDTCARPEHSWIVLNRQRAHPDTTAYYFHRQGVFFVSHALPIELMHEFGVFVDTPLIQQSWLAMVKAAPTPAPACEPGVIPPETFSAVTNGAQPLEPTAAAQKLAQAGLPPATAERLAQSLANFAAITIFTRLIHPPEGEPQPEAGATVVTDDQLTWLLEHQPPNQLSIRCAETKDLEQLVEHLLE